MRDDSDSSVLTALWVASAGIAGFVVLMVWAAGSEPHAFDTRILLSLREPGHPDQLRGPAWLAVAMRDISSFASTTVLLLVMAALVAYFFAARRRERAVWVLLVLGVGQMLTSLLKLAVDRPRPDLVSHLVEVATLSFPSGHAMGAAMTCGVLALMAAQGTPIRAARICLFCLAFIFTILVGFSRVYLGVHWPSDVLAGWCAGFAWVALCWLALRYFNAGKGGTRA